jgi:hypothetical protein
MAVSNEYVNFIRKHGPVGRIHAFAPTECLKTIKIGKEVNAVAPPFLISSLDAGEWPTSRPGLFILWDRTPGTHYVRGWVSPRANLDSGVGKNF